MSGRRARAGHAEVTASIKDRISGGLKRIKAKMNSFAASSAKIGGGLLGGALAAGSLFIAPIKSASRLQETMAKFDVVFGENAESVKGWADGFASEVGRSEQQIADFMASNQDLLVPMGLEPGAATEMSKQITGLAVDLASFNNMNDADAQRDLQAALTGSGEVMKKYGVVMSQAAVNQQLLNDGIDPKTATNAQKVYARMNIILKGTTAAQGDAVRSGNSWANVQKRIWASVDNTLASIGSGLLPIISEYGNKVAWLIETSGSWISQNQHIVQWIAAGIGVVGLAGVAFLGLGAVFGTVSAIISGATAAIGLFTTGVAIAGATVGFIVSPIGLVAAALIGGVGAWLYFSESGNNTITFITAKLGQLLEFGQKVFGGVYDAVVAGDWELAGKIMWTALRVAWATGIGWIQGLWIDFKFGMLSTFDVMVTGFRSKWNDVTAFLGKGIIWLIDKANAASEALTGEKLINVDTEEMRKLIDDENASFQNRIFNDQIKREQERLKDIDDAKKKLGGEALQRELDQLISQASEKRAQFDAELDQPIGPTEAQLAEFEPPTLSDLGSTTTRAGSGQSALGSFSLDALQAFSNTRTLEDQNLQANERTAEATEEMRDTIEDGFELEVTD